MIKEAIVKIVNKEDLTYDESVVSAFALFVERAARKAAFWVDVVSPPMISFITAYASSYVRSSLFNEFIY